MDALAGPFADAAPDSWGRRIMRSVYGDGLSEFDYLTKVDDKSRQGALRFLDAHGELLSKPKHKAPTLSDLKDLRNLASQFELDPQAVGEKFLRLVEATGSLGGARPKANVTDGTSLWIAKFTSIKDTWPVEALEVGTLRLAARVGLTVPEARLELVHSDHPVALFKRFDRKGDTRIPFMSARTALGKAGIEPGYYTDIVDAIRILSSYPKEDLRELWMRMLFGILVTNTDDHLKNHGFIHLSGNQWRLSPIFDVNPQPRRKPSMETGISPIHGFEPSIPAAIDAAPLFDIDQKAAEFCAHTIAMTLRNEWRQTLRKQGLSGSTLSSCTPAFEHERLEEALSLR